MLFQIWLRNLLHDAISKNRPDVIAQLNSQGLRVLFQQGVGPTIENVVAYQTQRDQKAA